MMRRWTEVLLEAAGGDVGLARELTAIFLEEMPRRIAELRAAAGAHDAQGLQAAAHTLKGSAATVGFEEVAKQALLIETRTRGGALDSAAVEAELERLAAACEAASREARSYLAGDG